MPRVKATTTTAAQSKRGYSGLATLEVLGYQSNELLIGFAIDGR
jgi:hypothetical protein